MTQPRLLRVFALLMAVFIGTIAANPTNVAMVLRNLAGTPVELFWVNTFSPANDLVLQSPTPVRNASELSINSFEGHSFLVRWARGTGMPEEHEAGFTVGKLESEMVVLEDEEHGLRVQERNKYIDNVRRVRGAIESCRDLHAGQNKRKTKSKSVFASVNADGSMAESGQVGEDEDAEALTDCIAEAVTTDMEKLHSELSLIRNHHRNVANRLRNYTCSDLEMETTKAVQSFDWRWQGRTIQVDEMLDSSHAKIFVLHDFITPHECKALSDRTRGSLQRATVAAADGTSVVSESRRAQQASYNVDRSNPREPLRNLEDRIYAFTNERTGYGISPEGQEGLTVIQYNPGDEYVPHCDGACDGRPHNSGGRVATTVLYCMEPGVGGGTTFSRADVFVRPRAGSAVWFSYMGADGVMDNGLTEHGGCPVVEGEKWIAAQWMRLGVTTDDSWENYDPTGVPAS